MLHPLVEYFRCQEHVAVLATAEGLSADPGYFRLADAVGYGRARGAPAPSVHGPLVDLSHLAHSSGGRVWLPFDLEEVVANLRYERYPEAQQAAARLGSLSTTRAAYYLLRPAMPLAVRKHLQRLHWSGWQRIKFPRWPVDTSVEVIMRWAAGQALERGGIDEFPFVWFWPEGASACVMMTHDVEGSAGMRFSDRLMDLDDAFDVPSAFQVVPDVPRRSRHETRRFVDRLRRRGFEVNVHDLAHDGRLFRHRERFLRHAATINARGREFGSRGFRSGQMYRRQDWLTALDIAYDMSVPNVAHLEPQRGGCCTVMPYFNQHVLELPLTMAQDYTVLHVLGEYSTAIWEDQAARILGEHGLLSIVAHPDYLTEPRAQDVYVALLRLIDDLRRERDVWLARPGEIDTWWRERREMTLVSDGTSWRVRGPGSERARVAWARIENDRVVYDVAPARVAA